MRFQNLVGRRVAYFRFQKKWSQQTLATKLQCRGVDVSRMSVARIELGHVKVNDTFLSGLQRVFRIPIVLFFSQEIQDLDADYAKDIASQLPKPVSTETPSKCQKLTKRRKTR